MPNESWSLTNAMAIELTRDRPYNEVEGNEIPCFSNPTVVRRIGPKGTFRLDGSMSKPTEIVFEGATVSGEELDYKTSKEEWSEYELEDGTVLRIRTAVARIVRLKDKWNKDGEPIYVVRSTNVLSPSVPPSLIRKPERIQ